MSSDVAHSLYSSILSSCFGSKVFNSKFTLQLTEMIDMNFIIYVQVIFKSWMKIAEVRITVNTNQCGFYPFDENR